MSADDLFCPCGYDLGHPGKCHDDADRDEPQLPGGNSPHTAEIAELRQRVALLERRLADVERKGSR